MKRSYLGYLGNLLLKTGNPACKAFQRRNFKSTWCIYFE